MDYNKKNIGFWPTFWKANEKYNTKELTKLYDVKKQTIYNWRWEYKRNYRLNRYSSDN